MNTPPTIDFIPRTRQKDWDSREQYGKILRGLIQSQLVQYKREKNRIRKTRISQNVGYLIQVQNSLINSDKGLIERLEALEGSVFKKKEIEI